MKRPALVLLTSAALLCATALPALAADASAPAATAAPSSASSPMPAPVVKTVNNAHLSNLASTTTPAPTVAASASAGAGSSTMTMLFGLLLVLGLIVCVAWLLKRSGLTPTMQASAAARVVGGVSVGNRERVVVVEIADQWIVVGVAPGRVNALATMPKQAAPIAAATLADPAAPSRNFASWMKQTLEKRNASR